MYAMLIKRVYAAAEPSDGYRVLVDRLWPRGIKKEAAGLELWAKGVAPSAELRKSFAHDAERFEAFKAAYLSELSANPEARAFALSCKAELKSRNVTLLYAAKDEAHNNAVALREWLAQEIVSADDPERELR